MSRQTWKQDESKIQEMLIATLKLIELDFEQKSVTSNQMHLEQRDATPWMTRREAAKYARVSTDTIDNWCAADHIKKSKLGKGRPGSVLIERDSLEKFLRSRIVNGKKRIRKTPPSVKGGYRVESAD